MPSFTEMYYRLQGYNADPHLKPEEMRALELGTTLNYKRSTVNCVIWHHHGRNMIDWIMDTSLGDEAVWQSVNHTRINSLGFEADLQFKVQSSKFKVSYSYIHQDKEHEPGIVSQYALEYLRHKLVANAQCQLLQNLSLNLNFRWQDRVGSYTDFDSQTHDYEPYALTDARLTWQQQRYKLYLEANNLFDTRYHDFGLVEQPGRWLIAGLCLNL